MAMELKHLNPQHVMDVTGKAIDEISRLRAENAELKAQLESEKESRYADSVDAGMRERKLKRTLYKACANWADCEAGRLFWEEDMKKAEKFDKMVDKCRAMAEEYK